MTRTLIEMNQRPNGSVDNQFSIKASVGIGYTAGTDTIDSAINTFVIAMMIYPDVQRKAQATIDALISDERLPMFADRAELPYLDAVLKEVLRWKPVTPLAIAHRSMEDDVYRGFHIPAKSFIFPNAWQCLHNEADFPEPEIFNPNRFLGDSALNPSKIDPRDFAFGFGRRICPGRYLAEASLWINIAILLAVFNITKPLDAQGNAIEPNLDYLGSIAVNFPKPFASKFTVRSPQKAENLRILQDSMK